MSYARVPEAVLYDHTLSSHAVRVYAELDRRANKEGYCWPSQERIAERIGVSVRCVQRSIAELRNAGHIAVDRRGRGHSNGYLLTRHGRQVIDDDMTRHGRQVNGMTRHGWQPRPATGGSPDPPPVAAQNESHRTRAREGRGERDPRALAELAAPLVHHHLRDELPPLFADLGSELDASALRRWLTEQTATERRYGYPSRLAAEARRVVPGRRAIAPATEPCGDLGDVACNGIRHLGSDGVATDCPRASRVA